MISKFWQHGIQLTPNTGRRVLGLFSWHVRQQNYKLGWTNVSQREWSIKHLLFQVAWMTQLWSPGLGIKRGLTYSSWQIKIIPTEVLWVWFIFNTYIFGFAFPLPPINASFSEQGVLWTRRIINENLAKILKDLTALQDSWLLNIFQSCACSSHCTGSHTSTCFIVFRKDVTFHIFYIGDLLSKTKDELCRNFIS